MSDNLLEYLSYDSLADHYDELLVSNYWTIKVLKWPAVAYNPNEELIKIRLQSITGIPEPSPSLLEFNVRSYQLYQTGTTSVPNGELQLSFVDYEDSSILFWMRSWRDTQHYWAQYTANRLEYCIAEWKIYRCNKEGRAVRAYVCKRMLITEINYPEDFTADSQLVGDNVTASVRALVKSEMLNYNGG